MTQWNDSDVPLAYLLTVRTYGTWLHGDKRGSVDRLTNKFGTPRIPRRDFRREYNESILKADPVLLTVRQIEVVDFAIREVCDNRRWALHAINVRTNHFHVVVKSPRVRPDKPLNAFKAYATRRLRESNLWSYQHSPWADRGSERWLWTERSVADACHYVIAEQGDPLIRRRDRNEPQ